MQAFASEQRNAATLRPGDEYRHPGALFDITVGNNDLLDVTGGAACGFDCLCTAKTSYDAPTGLGTLDGIGARVHRDPKQIDLSPVVSKQSIMDDRPGHVLYTIAALAASTRGRW